MPFALRPERDFHGHGRSCFSGHGNAHWHGDVLRRDDRSRDHGPCDDWRRHGGDVDHFGVGRRVASITANYGGDQDFVGGVSRNISTPVGGLSGATAVAVDAQGDLFISAIYGNDGSIREVRPDGSIAFYRGGGATALAVDAKGDLFFTANDSLVNEVEPGPDGLLSDGTTVTIAGGGPNSNSNPTGPATAANLDAPAGLALDARGDLYITDLYNRVLEVTPGPDGLLSDGAIATIAGLGDPLGSTGQPGFGGYCGDGGPAISASLWQPIAWR